MIHPIRRAAAKAVILPPRAQPVWADAEDA